MSMLQLMLYNKRQLRPSIHTAKTRHSRSRTQLTLRRYQNLSIAPTDMSYAILAYIVVDRLCTFYNAVRGRQHTFDTSQTRRKDDHRRKSNNPYPETGNTANALQSLCKPAGIALGTIKCVQAYRNWTQGRQCPSAIRSGEGFCE